MREIKFRAWDKKNKMMLLNDSLSTHFISFNGSIGVHDNCGNVKYNDGESFVSEKIIPMQYTGLKDKNGNEIYEGDILSILQAETDISLKDVVVWEDAGFRMKYARFDQTCEWADKSEVIGNIYDNPELLNPPQAAQQEGGDK